MILAFSLSMPNVASWNGKWSGDGGKYVIVRNFRSKPEIENAIKIRDKGYYRYSWSDGWAAGIDVKEVDSKQAAKLRKETQGFAGYDWMVESIIQCGKPMADYDMKQSSETKIEAVQTSETSQSAGAST